MQKSVKRTTNPIATANKALGLKIPTSVKIGNNSVGLDPGKQIETSAREVKKIGQQAETDWRNAGKGEIGKWAAGYGQSVYNIAAAPVNWVSGKSSFERESQKTWGGFHNLAGFGTSAYFGQSSGVQEFLRDENLTKNTFGLSKNYAGTSRGSFTMNTAGTISNEDRVQAQQLGVKVAAVLAAIFGGAAAFGGGAAPAGGAGAGAGAAGTGSSAALTMPTLGSSAGYGATASYGLGTASAGTAAASGGGWLATAGTVGGNVGLLYSALSGNPAPSSIGDIFTGGGINPEQDSGLLDPIWDLFQDREPAAVYSSEAPSALAGMLPQTDEGKAILWTGVAVALAYYLWTRHG